MLLSIFLILAILWLLGLLNGIGGGAIHILIVVAVCVLVYDLIRRRM